MKIEIELFLSQIISRSELVRKLSPIFNCSLDDEVHFSINLNCNFINPDYLVLIVNAVYYLREKKITVSGKFINLQKTSSNTRYASRIDFFNQLNFDFKEDYTRKDSKGKFTEITLFDDNNVYEVYEKIILIILNNEVNEEMLTILHYCIYEIFDNTLRHSMSNGTESNGKGFVSCQYYPKIKEIRLIISDCGQGIFNALTKNPESEFKDLSPSEALLKCIDNKVTGSTKTGRGFGLYATSKLVELNKGQLIIHSGNQLLNCSTGSKSVTEVDYWEGVYVFLRINTDVPVDYGILFEDDSQMNSFSEHKERLIGDLDKLW